MESIQRDDILVRDADAPVVEKPVETADPVVTADPVETAKVPGTGIPAGQPPVDPGTVVQSNPAAVAEKIEPRAEDQALAEELQPEGKEVVVDDRAAPETDEELETVETPAGHEVDIQHLAVPSDPPSVRERAQAEGYYGAYPS
ncbi:MAG TPA: hypothetical protein VG815_02725 [Chloroflexota bacterium]|nr:hypothetical protein [Chloroflexota bacterium]